MHADDKLFYVGQKAFIEKNGEVLVLFDPNLPKNGIDFPGGKIRKDEQIPDALKREVHEETGLAIKIGDPFAVWLNEFVSDGRSTTTVYLVGFMCTYVSGAVRLSDEHVRFEWVNKDTYKKLDDGTEYFNALEKYFKMKSI